MYLIPYFRFSKTHVMNQLLTLITFCIYGAFSFAQTNYNYEEVFVIQCGPQPIIIDTLDPSDNGIWQVAHPVKPEINGSALGDMVLITDSINPYPVSDSSSFEVRVLEEGGLYYGHTFDVLGYYRVDTDSLNDYMTIEVMLPGNPEYGWIDVFEDSLPDQNAVMQHVSQFVGWFLPEPVFTGNSFGWKDFWLDLRGLREVDNFSIQMMDTIRIRFTFHSDEVFDNRSGIALDNIRFCNYVEGIDELHSEWFSVSPNPGSTQFSVNIESPDVWTYDYGIFDLLGKRVGKGTVSNQNPYCTISELQSGVYQFVLSTKEGKPLGMKKFIRE